MYDAADNHSFVQMSHLLVGQFIGSRRQWKGSNSLVNIKQKEEKSICYCLSRFNVAVLEFHDLDQSVAMTTLKGGSEEWSLVLFGEDLPSQLC